MLLLGLSPILIVGKSLYRYTLSAIPRGIGGYFLGARGDQIEGEEMQRGGIVYTLRPFSGETDIALAGGGNFAEKMIGNVLFLVLPLLLSIFHRVFPVPV